MIFWVSLNYYLKNLLFCIGVYSRCDSFKWTAKGLSHTYTCIHSTPNSLLIQLPHDTEQSSLCCSRICWLSIINIARAYMLLSNSLSLPALLPHLATISLLSKSVNLKLAQFILISKITNSLICIH